MENGYNILIVDDSATMRAIVKRTLGMTQLPLGQLLEAGSGQEALDMLECVQLDLVLADINMPGMNGIELARRLLENPETHELPVIMVSTECSETRVREMKAQGVRGFIHKPFTPETMRDAVQAVFSNQETVVRSQ